jgi:hypothetical protein
MPSPLTAAKGLSLPFHYNETTRVDFSFRNSIFSVSAAVRIPQIAGEDIQFVKKTKEFSA